MMSSVSLSDERLTIPRSKRLPQLHGIPVPTSYAESTAASVNPRAKEDDDANPLEAAAASSATPLNRGPRICMVKRVTHPSLQLAHMLNAVRASAKTELRGIIQRLLTRELKICQPEFDLDDPSNMVWFRTPDLHIMLDLYCVFFISPSTNHLDAILHWLDDANRTWQAACDAAGSSAVRLLDLFDPCLSSVMYNIFILHPTYFFPDSALVLPLNDAPALGRSLWEVSDADLVNSATKERLPPFSKTPAYAGLDPPVPLNPVLAILNAELKYRHHVKTYRDESLSQSTKATGTKLIEVVEAIYFQVKPSPGSFGEKVDAAAAQERATARAFMEKQRAAQRQAKLDAGGGSRSSSRISESGGSLSGSVAALSAANLDQMELHGQEEELDVRWREMEENGGGSANQKRDFMDLYQTYSAEISEDFPYALQS